MTLFNQNWIGFGGTPITGKVPTQTIVHGDELTQPQHAGVRHAYKLFCDAINVSVFPGGYHVQNRALQDGSQVRMTSISGVHQVHVWPVGSPEQSSRPHRGFVVSPKWVSGYAVNAKLDHSILTFIEGGEWKPVPRHTDYLPGQRRTSLRYFVASTRTAPMVKGDADYHDVFCVWGGYLHKNAKPIQPFAIDYPTGVPVPFKAGDKYKIVYARPDVIIGFNEADDGTLTPVIADNWGAFYAPVVAGIASFAGGPEIRRGPDVNDENEPVVRVSWIGYNVTPTVNTQTWLRTVRLQATAPFAVVEHAVTPQLGPSGYINSNTGWTGNTSAPGPVYFMLGGPSAEAYSIGYIYTKAGDGYWYLGSRLYADALEAQPGSGGISTYTFDKTYDLPETMALNQTEVVTIQRSCVIHAEYVGRSGVFSQIMPAGAPPILGAPGVGPGAVLGTGYTESLNTTDQWDNSSCTITAPGLPRPIYDVQVARTFNLRTGGTVETHASTTPAFGSGPVNLAAQAAVTVTNGSSTHTTAFFERLNVATVSGSARDFVYSDRANEVYVWIEAEVTGVFQYSDPTGSSGVTSGTTSTTLRSCISFRGEETKTVIYSLEENTPPLIQSMEPDGIDFGVSAHRFQYHVPVRPPPIYAPLWQDQGLCPFIAHTTTDEHGRVAPRIAAHFRLHLYRTGRVWDEPDIAVVPDAPGFAPYMCEVLLNAYTRGAAFALNPLEEVATVITHSFPDPHLFKHIGAPVDDVKEYAEIYRT